VHHIAQQLILEAGNLLLRVGLRVVVSADERVLLTR